MIRLADANGRLVSRRYSVRSVDEANDTLTLWVTVEHEGPGSTWAQNATARRRDRRHRAARQDSPRRRRRLAPLPRRRERPRRGVPHGGAASRCPSRAIFIIEIDAPDDALSATFDEGLGVTGIFVDRRGRELNDPAGLFSGLAAFELPSGVGHAYLFGEFHVVRALQAALLDRGLAPEQISHKPYWRAGTSNAEHGEPDKSYVYRTMIGRQDHRLATVALAEQPTRRALGDLRQRLRVEVPSGDRLLHRGAHRAREVPENVGVARALEPSARRHRHRPGRSLRSRDRRRRR